MSDIHVTIKEDGETGKKITLKEVQPGIYKLDHPLADPDRIFIRNGDDINDMVLFAFMHLSNRKEVK